MKVLVTGSNGFVGRHLCNMLKKNGIDYVPAVRNPTLDAVAVGSIDGETDWSEALQGGVTHVVHTAARVHILRSRDSNSVDEFQKVNVDATVNLATQAAEKKVLRFVFISSIAVHGLTSGNIPFSYIDTPQPHDEYGASKYAAEKIIRKICSETDMEGVVIRPPLVYGPGVGANFLRLMKLTKSRIPLPFKTIHNSRSFVFVENLCSLILDSLSHPKAAGELFLISDDHDISTYNLLREIAKSIGGHGVFVPVPEALLRILGALTGHSGEVSRLCGSLELDISHVKHVLGWTPPVSFEDGIRQTVEEFLKGEKNG